MRWARSLREFALPRKRPTAVGRSSDQDRTAVHDKDLARAVGLPHEVEIRLSDLRRVPHVADWQLVRYLLIQRRAVRFRHVRPQWRLHNAGRDDVDANG